MNLIPVCPPGVSFGGELLTKAIHQFRSQLLAVIIACPEKNFEYSGESATPDSITRANINAAICLFRERGTIGDIVGFIHEDGMNINLSGTGGRYGKEFMSCLSRFDIQPWFYPVESAYNQMANWSGNVEEFDIDKLSIYERLQNWERFLIDEIYPQLYTESLGLFGGWRTGTWQESWKASDINLEYVDEDQLNAILNNTDFYGTFLSEISNLRTLNNLNLGDQNAKGTLQRQIYIGAITSLETYLSDAFINTVLSDDRYIRSFFSSFKDFESRKFNLNQLFNHVDRSREVAMEAMLKVIYHNIPKVSHMYEDVLDISFPDFSKIQVNIVTRHDLVHRNGKTKDGKEVDVNRAVVEQVITRVENFVREIDQQLKKLL